MPTFETFVSVLCVLEFVALYFLAGDYARLHKLTEKQDQLIKLLDKEQSK